MNDSNPTKNRLIDWVCLVIGLGLGFEGVAWRIPGGCIRWRRAVRPRVNRILQEGAAQS